MAAMRYRLALDLGSTSLGWAMIRLSPEGSPCAVIRAGVRIFPDGRNPKDGTSLAVTRREARAMRRRRDRLLKRKARMTRTLIAHGFFPADEAKRKALETLNPYALRTKGLDHALNPEEFARAIFHINQRRGFKSNRKTDKKDSDSGALKQAISALRLALDPTGNNGKPRTVGELLHRRQTDASVPPEHRTVRARYRQSRVLREDGKARIEKSYDLYIDRAMIEAEFEAIWTKQSSLNPALFHQRAHDELKDCLLHQRPLKPVRPGRCTLIPEEERAPLALPSQQRFRILQELNNLRILNPGLQEQALTLEQRDLLAAALERGHKSFKTAIPKLLGLAGATQFNLADAKRLELKGNATSMTLSKASCFGETWHHFSLDQQDEIVLHLLQEENESTLVQWLQENAGVDAQRAEHLANTSLAEGYGSLSAAALSLIVPELKKGVVSYADAAKAAGFHHSRLSDNSEVPGRTTPIEVIEIATGEIKTFHRFYELPYYGEFLQRHVGFADPRATANDPPEKRFGKIANPTVHIGLNQVRTVVNALIKRYGHPDEVIVEVARDLKQSQDQRKEDQERQAKNQRRNERLRANAAAVLNVALERVRHGDIQKLLLWEELSNDPADRRCPYSGVQLSVHMVLSDQVEVEHILPFSQTLDDSLNNKTVAMRQANRVKGNRTPWNARADFAQQRWAYSEILERAEQMPRGKRYRFAEDGYTKWLNGGDNKDGKGFLARALNDTRYLSRVAREYLSMICPQSTRVIPGQMTAMLRGKFGLNDILGLDGEKNRNDHRHHAVDACVIAVTDQRLLQRFASASASARERQLDRLVEVMPDPWPTYREHVRRAVNAILVSHKPDHGHEGSMFKATAYGIRRDGSVVQKPSADGESGRIIEYVVPITSPEKSDRHGINTDGLPRAYKGYVPDGNFCIDIICDEMGKWQGEVTATFEAYSIARKHGTSRLRDTRSSFSGKKLLMRVMIDDLLRLEVDGRMRVMRVASINAAGRLSLADHNEANVDARNRDKNGDWRYTYKQAGSLKAAKGRRVTVSPIGDISDPGFKSSQP